MKRRVLSLVIALTLCLNLCPTWALAAAVQSDTIRDGSKFTDNVSVTSPHVVSGSVTIDTDVYTLTAPNSTAIQVTGTGTLDLRGRVISRGGSGVEVETGGSLRITEPGTVITSVEYGLDIASGANVYLSAGRYTGYSAAIRTADGDFAALLAEGCAYFADDGTPILSLDMAAAMEVNVRTCEHSEKSYTPTSGTTAHTWTCPYCGTSETENCTVNFDENGAGTCACGNSIQIIVDETGLSDLVYDGTLKPGNIPVTVTLTDGSGKELLKNTDYSINYEPRTDAGAVTLTVTGITFNGTFTKTYTVKQDQPGIKWDELSLVVNYGDPITLPHITITIKPANNEDLHQYLQYSYRKVGETDFTDGLPLNAGEYEVKAYIPESQNYTAAETNPCLKLTIKKISALITAPEPTKPVYDRNSHELVTAGTSHAGTVIEFATSENGTYSTAIPTGIDAGSYNVWYRIADTENYTGITATKVDDVIIQPKSITPTVEVSEPSYTYDGSKKAPKITVKDVDFVISDSQYTVTWAGTKDQEADSILRDVGKYTATIKSVDTGNYTFDTTAEIEIVNAAQGALTITGQPEHVYYGNKITTLGTTGGTGNGEVKWSITAGGDSAEIVEDTGVLTVKGTGSVTVKAERVVPNYGTVSDTWTFNVEPKPVLAEVTVAAKAYDGNTTANITAAIKAGDLVASTDSVPLSGLTGTYDTANAGTGKTVTLNDTGATKADGNGKYAVSYPATVKGDINRRNVTVTVTLSGNDLKTDDSGNWYYYNGTDRTPNVTVEGLDASGYKALLMDSDYSVSYADNRNVGDATVTVTAKAGGNYTFDDAAVKFAIRNASAVLTQSPPAKDLTYTGQPQDLVGVGTATGGTVVYSDTNKDDPDSYSETIPQGKDAGTYTVYYKVKGDTNHSDTESGQVSVTIKPKPITPAITLEQDSYVYNGTAHEPTVTVKDGETEIPGPGDTKPEYSVSYQNNTNAGTATVTVSDNNGGNYVVNGTASFTITKAVPTVTAPTAKTTLQYNGEKQDLVNAGVTGHGTVKYSVNGGNYTTDIPSASAVGTYNINWMVEGDANHKDTTPATLTVQIGQNQVTNPTITLSSEEFKYTGGQQKPVITVYDNHSRLIPEHEYTVEITGKKSNNMVDVDTYTVTITTPDSSNYVINSNNTRTFKIVPADQETISITGTQAGVHYGDKIQLGTTGGTGEGTLRWEVTAQNGSTITSTISATGLLTVKDVGGPYIVKVTRTIANYGDVSASWEFTAAKKPVTAEVTAADRDYVAGDKNTTVTAAVPDSLLVTGDSIEITGLSGMFDSDSVGTGKKVTVDRSNPNIAGTNSEKYNVTIPSTTTASIRAVAATVDTAPAKIDDLTYDASQSQNLVTAGTATGGTMVYSLDGTNFTANIPQSKNAGTYQVRYKAQGDQNHTDSDVGTVDVTIVRQRVEPGDIKIELSPPSAQYDGTVQQPAVTVRDKANNVIPTSEYKVTYITDNGGNWKDQGMYTVKIENITGGNYFIAEGAEKRFTINASAQAPLEIVNKPGLVYYGDTFTLSAVGGSASQTVTWSINNTDVATVDANNGIVTVIGTGEAVITATRPGGTNYEAATATYPFSALQKPVMAIVKADDKVYDGNTNATVTATLQTSDFVGTDRFTITLADCTFEDAKVGTDKKVNVVGTNSSVNGGNVDKYAISYPATVTASISKAVAKLQNLPVGLTQTHNGSARALVAGGTTVGGIGKIVYSLNDQNGPYSEKIPTASDIGTYTVWYKVADSVNYTGIPSASVRAEIVAASSTPPAELPSAGLDNALSMPPASAPSADEASAPAQAPAQDSAASATVSAGEVEQLAQEALENQSGSIVVKPDLSGDVTRAEVPLPAETVNRIVSADAPLTVSTPIADATIPQAALETLGRAGDVSVVTELVDRTVTLRLTAGGEAVESVPGGVTLAVPVEDAGPGTVAVLVHEDGTRETISKSTVVDGKMMIPLDGSATVEIVDNSKAFEDVPADSWASDAVAFASAREMFSGTGESTFSPDEPMSRGMLATVLYNLEGRPEQDVVMQDLDGGYSDVDGDAWYADGVAWATENGIVNGYGNGSFGPDDSVTREQLAVMLWKYAGSPEAGNGALDFTDADEANSYAEEALRWAVDSGIVNGYADGRLAPGGTATRAEAAQMLKNFMERA